MSKFQCDCGYTIASVPYPCPYESIVILDKQYESVLLEMGKALAAVCHLEPVDRRNWLVHRFGDAYPIDAEDAQRGNRGRSGMALS